MVAEQADQAYHGVVQRHLHGARDMGAAALFFGNGDGLFELALGPAHQHPDLLRRVVVSHSSPAILVPARRLRAP
jgi:hypothetical protein